MFNRAHGWQRYGLALVVTGAATLLSVALRPLIQATPTVLLIPAILISAWFGGLGPGILASLLSTLALAIVFIPPTNSIWPGTLNDGLDLIVFVLVTLSISGAASNRRRAEAQAQQAREQSQRATERTVRLQTVTAALSQAAAPGEVVEVILRQGAAALEARTVSLAMLSPDGQWLTNAANSGYPPEVAAQFQRYPITSHIAAADAARTGEAIWSESAEVYLARYPERGAVMAAIGFQAAAAVPLRLERRLLGVMVVTFSQKLVFDDEVRGYILTLASYCAQALERARLYEAEQRARQAAEQTADRVARLQRVTARLAEALSATEVVAAVVNEAAEPLGARAAAIQLIEAGGENLRMTGAVGYAHSVTAQYNQVPLSAPVPSAQVARTGQPLWIQSNAELLEQFPRLANARVSSQFEAVAVLPLGVDNRRVGALTLNFDRQMAFDENERGFLMALAQQCALALERTRLYEAEQQARQAAEQATERQRQLGELVAAFMRSMTREQVAQAFVERGLAMLGATAGSVAVVAADGELEIVHAAGYPPAVQNRWTRFPLTEPVPLAEAVRTSRAIWIQSAQELAQRYPSLESVTQRTGHTAMACLPLVAAGRTLGALGLSFTQAEALSPEQRELALTLAEECAQALDRAQAYGALQDSVREHSRELEAANARLQGEVQEREQAQAQLAASYEQLRELAGDLQQAREEERRRLSRELHDVLGGALTGLKLTVARMRRHTAGSAEASSALDEALSQMDEAIGLVRRLATDLRPAALDDLGLLAALEWLVQDFGDRSGLDCRLETELAELELDPETAIGVYRVVQESLTNVARHAQATAVRVSLAQEPGCLVLRVADDGRGFQPGEPAKAHSLGLAGMRERAYAFAGELEITSAPGTGTTVTVTIPRGT